MSVIDITPKPKADPDVVRFLEERLAEAKKGQIQGLAIVTLIHGGDTGNGWINIGSHIMAVLGEVDVLHRDLMDDQVDLGVGPRTGHTVEDE